GLDLGLLGLDLRVEVGGVRAGHRSEPGVGLGVLLCPLVGAEQVGPLGVQLRQFLDEGQPERDLGVGGAALGLVLLPLTQQCPDTFDVGHDQFPSQGWRRVGAGWTCRARTLQPGPTRDRVQSPATTTTSLWIGPVMNGFWMVSNFEPSADGSIGTRRCAPITTG